MRAAVFLRRWRLSRAGLLVMLLLMAAHAQALVPIKGDIDHRDYRYLELENGLKVLLISDPQAEKAAASLDVHVGHHQNPLGREGLAHFLEHMLFLGTEKYPEPGAYPAFISRHGGSHNAYTASEHTNYFFDIDPEYLEPALDRFAQFFIAPRFNPEYVDRERFAVESEFKARLNDDARRIHDVYQALMNPAHPAARFGVGNLTTLADTEERPLRADLIDFYQRYYSSDLMSLVVLGRENLDALQKQVTERFKAIPVRDVSLPEAYPPLFGKDQLPMRVSIEPEKDLRRLSLLFPLPVSAESEAHKPLHYIGHLLGHEGEGSLLSLLKELGWAEGLSAGTRHRDRHDALFQVSIELTELGVRAADQIVALVFHAIKQIEARGLDAWRYEELQQMANIDFRFQEVRSPVETVRGLAHRLHLYDPVNVLWGDYRYAGYDARLIKKYLGYLNSGNVLVSLVAPTVEGNVRSPYYQAPYRVDDQPVEQPAIKARIQKQLTLPKPNDFIPTRLAVKEAPLLPGPGASPTKAPGLPEAVVDKARIKVWYQWDQEFEVPKTSMRLRLKLPRVAGSVEGATKAELLSELVRDQLNEFAYPAQLAGLDFSLRPNTRGLDIEIFGYSSRQNLLLTRIVEALRKGRFEQDRFDDLKRTVARRWRNEALDTPYGVIARQVPRLHFAPYSLGRDKLRVLEGIDLKAIHQFADSVLKDAELEVLLYGNLYRQEAVRLAAYLEHQLLGDLTRQDLAPARVFRLKSRGPWVYERPLEHDDSVTMLYVQGLSTELDDVAHMQLARRLLQPAFFHELRTEKQLGYVATVFGLPLKDQEGTVLVVQSPSVDSDRLWREMDGFLAGAEIHLKEGLAEQKTALVRELREPAKTLYQQSDRYWEGLMMGDTRFDRRERLAQAVEAVTADSLQAYYRKVFADPARRLWLVTDRSEEAPAAKVIDAIPDYQKALEALSYP
ncbi:insulinase family protein [Marinimicrobium sp. C6131]|uniref:insulinase family protein n=1 Tax=Marinimicrobium sp. C6131 TaxID=3022676 RepID=UPI00223DD065|nr:insulinase family protein [Marinimicrobium sp. C6131]UZJ45826.1 insulinase family protein [Marinimicrobium sp. C6131]